MKSALPNFPQKGLTNCSFGTCCRYTGRCLQLTKHIALRARGGETCTMSYADIWNKWFDTIEAGAAHLSRRLILLSDVASAHRVLDIGTGIGEPALSAARLMDNWGHVLGVDHDPNMIAKARLRAQQQSVGNVEFRVGAAETLNLAENSLDAVLARWSLMFVDDMEGLLAKLNVALRPEGKLAAATWALPEQVPALSLARSAVERHFGLEASLSPSPKAFSLSDPDALKVSYERAGFSNVAIETVPVVYEFPSTDAYISYRQDAEGPLWEGIRGDKKEIEQEARRAIETAMRPFQVPDGRYRLVNQALCVVGAA